MSDSSGFVYDSEGINREKLSWIMDLKNNRRGRISEYAEKYSSAIFTASAPEPSSNGLWDVNVDVALPCATQNEINGEEAKMLVANKVMAVAEGANMPCTPEAVEVFLNNGVMFAPGKASNAGGVATSGLEMSQNSLRYNWTREEVDAKLDQIVRLIDYLKCLPVKTIALDKVEADDIIAHLATTITNTHDNSRAFIVSSDKDFIQLTSNKICVYRPIEKDFYTPETVVEKFNVLPENFILYKVLMGDA